MSKTGQENPFGFDPEADVVRDERTQWLDPIVVISGGFDPVHKGHTSLFVNAATHGKIHVLLNSDEWLARKKGAAFLPFETRKDILENISSISEVHEVDDRDESVMQGLAALRKRYKNTKIYFANGGDRKLCNTPEMQICEHLGIDMLWNVGGDKIDSSSDLLNKYQHRRNGGHTTSRKWGTYDILEQKEKCLVKLLTILPRQSISYQRHYERSEQWLVLAGRGLFVLDEKKFEIAAKDSILVPPMSWHWVKNISQNQPLCILETWFGDILKESDIEREDFDETAVS
jgi:D-beta-D-heptose 7-phosphate kinase/D-beta-D-heptose 1-phosphate adenosyltransferase